MSSGFCIHSVPKISNEALYKGFLYLISTLIDTDVEHSISVQV